jgi:hypothetical protein
MRNEEEIYNLEYETSNSSGEYGDYVVVNNPNNLMERYVVKKVNFHKSYEVPGTQIHDNVFSFQSKQNLTRQCIIITQELYDFFVDIGLGGENLSQITMLNIVKNLKKQECRKIQAVMAWKWTEEDGTIETHVKKTKNTLLLWFETPWGGTMPLKLGDTIIVTDDECYRIAQEEFQRTYQLV